MPSETKMVTWNHHSSFVIRQLTCRRLRMGVCGTRMMGFSMPLFMTLFHSTRDIDHRQQDEDKGLDGTGEQRKEHHRDGSQKWKNVFIQRPDDQLFRKDVAK